MLAAIPHALLAAACLLAVAFDIASRRIPNWLNLLILLGGTGFLFALPDMAGAAWHLAHFALALVAAMLLFGMRMWGGGDAKFYAAVAVWFPLAQAPLLAGFTALAGLGLVIIYFGLARLRHGPDRLRELPYGVAIACGVLAIIALELAGYLAA